MTKDYIDRAVERLRRLNPELAAAEACVYAERLSEGLPAVDACTQEIQLQILALGLYFSAATNHAQGSGFATLQSIVEERYRRALSNSGHEEVFDPLVEYPPSLCAYLRSLAALPRDVFIRNVQSVRTLLSEAR